LKSSGQAPLIPGLRSVEVNIRPNGEQLRRWPLPVCID
jgi:hypothetical protein